MWKINYVLIATMHVRTTYQGDAHTEHQMK